MILLLATLAFGCDPAESDLLRIQPDDGSTGIPVNAWPMVQLGDRQQWDPDLVVELLDGSGQPVPMEARTSSHTEILGNAVYSWRLATSAPLLPDSSYEIVVRAPGSDPALLSHGFTTGSTLAAAPGTPSATILDLTDENDDDMCLGNHRMLTVTLSPAPSDDDLTAVLAFVHEEGDAIDIDGNGRTLRLASGPVSVRLVVPRLEGLDAPTCVTPVQEGPDGTRVAGETTCASPDAFLGETDDTGSQGGSGCGCSATHGFGPWWLLALVPLLRRRR